MIYEIKRANSVIAAVRANGTQERSVMAIDRVVLSFTLPDAVEFKRGDTVDVYGQTYKMNRSANDNQTSDKLGYQYELEFEALYYDLAKWQLRGLDKNNELTQGEVFVMGTASTIVDLIVRNANRVDSGWTMGIVDDTDAQQFSYINQSLLSVLQDLANQFETEFHIDNKTIHLQKREASTGITLEYGKGKGLYELFRGRTETSVINRLYVEGGSRNLPQGYGYQRLQLPAANRPYLQAPLDPNEEIIEHSITIDNIFPSRVGSVTAVGSNILEVTDNTIDFNINDHLSGVNAKVSFITGQLASFEFEISAYDHATKKVTIIPITDDKAYPDGIPSSLLKPAIGDKYVLLDINMPVSYVTEAQNKLLAAGQTYLDANKDDKHDYRVSLAPNWVRQNNPSLTLGYTVHIRDVQRGIDKNLRIAGYSRDIQDDTTYTALSLQETITPSEIARQYAQQERILYAIMNSGLLDPEQMRKNLFLNRLSERDGYLLLGPDKIKAGFADLAADSELWDGHEFEDYLNQPVRTTDEPKFKGTGSPAFVSGFSGNGWAVRDENGNINATFDNLTVRKEMNVYELIINQIRATNGSLWVSDAIKIFSVEVSGSNYICRIDTDGNRVGVPFVVNDIIRCQRWTGRNVKYYVARVTNIGSGSFTVVKLEGGGVPEAGDDVVRMGNTTNTNRQGALYLTSSDSNSPYLDVIDGVNSASLVGKTKVRLGKLDGITDPDMGALTGYGLYGQNVYLRGKIHITGGNAATKTYAEEKASEAQAAAIAVADAAATAAAAANNYINEILPDKFADIDAALDGLLEQYFEAYDPSLSNAPASGWNTTTVKEDHLGDLFYNTSNGKSWRWVKEAGAFLWKEIVNSDLSAALQAASQAQDTADAKRRVFTTTPFTPYDVGDLWVQGANGDIMRAKTAKTSAQTYALADWEKASKYTDDTLAEEAAAAIADLEDYVDGSFADGIIEESEAIAIEKYINTLNAEKGDIDNRYNAIYNDPLLAGNTKSNLLGAKNAFNDAHAALISAINVAISDKKTTATEKADVDSKFATYRTRLSALSLSFEVAVNFVSQAKVDSIQIGGTNLLNHSKMPTTASSEQVDADKGSVRFVSTDPVYWGNTYNTPLIAGEVVTFSISCRRLSGSGTLGLLLNPENTYQALGTVGTAWTILRLTRTIVGRVSLTDILHINGITSSGLLIEWVKLEKGNKATDWSPSPQDTTSAINTLSTELGDISDAVDSLEGTVNGAFSDGKIEEIEAIAIAKYINSLNSEKADVDNRYSTIYADVNLTGNAKTNLLAAKTAYNTAHANLISSINAAIADKKTTPTEKADVDAKFTAYRTALAALSVQFEQAVTAISTKKANDALDAAKNDATTKDNALKTVVQNYADAAALSQANIAKAAAISTASDDAQAKATAAENAAKLAAQGYVNSLQIGGENLIASSKTPSTPSTVYSDPVKGSVRRTNVDPTFWMGGLSSALVGGEAVTFSISCRRLSGSGPIAMFLNNSNGYIHIGNVGTNWVTLSLTRTIVGGVSITDIPHVNGVTSAGLLIEWVKLEKGNKATDWSPSYSDVNTAIAAADARAAAAQTAYANLTAALKPLAYAEHVERAQLGNTIMQGGLLKNEMIDTAYLRANLITAQNINALDLTAKAIRTGTTGVRVEINTAGDGAIKAFNAAGAQTFGVVNGFINATGGGNIALLKIDNEGLYADSVAGYGSFKLTPSLFHVSYNALVDRGIVRSVKIDYANTTAPLLELNSFRTGTGSSANPFALSIRGGIEIKTGSPGPGEQTFAALTGTFRYGLAGNTYELQFINGILVKQQQV